MLQCGMRAGFHCALVVVVVVCALVGGCPDRNRQAALERLQLVVDEQNAADVACVARLGGAADVKARADVALDCRDKRALQRQRYDGLLTMVPRPSPGERIAPFPDEPQPLKDAPADGDGKRLFVAHRCAVCHSLDGSALVGNSVKGLYGSTITHSDGSSAVVDDAYLKEAILAPERRVTKGFVPTMPAYAGTLNEATVEVLVEFIKSVK